jgi:CubicO group peptidase (beta-lactamase class C family)
MCPLAARAVTALALAIAFIPAAQAFDFAPIRQGVVELLETGMKEEEIPGASIALVDDQRILWAQGFGLADKTRGERARAETVYPVGTLSQLLTATAVLQLAEKGAIDLDGPIAEKLPEFSIKTRFAPGAPITMRRLLSHHAGLPAMHFKGMWTARPLALAATVAQLRDEYTAYPSNHVYSPSDPGYAVAGRLIEVVTGREFGAYMQTSVLAPLGMRESTFNPVGITPRLRAKGYWRGTQELPDLRLRDTPAKGLYSNVTDLARFVQMLFAGGVLDGKRVLRESSIAEMLRVQNADVPLDLDARVGLGWRLSGVRLDTAPRAKVAWLYNASPTGRGRILLVPEHKLAVILLTNSSKGARTVEQVSEALLESVLQARGVRAAPPVTAPAVAAPAAPAPVTDVAGHYASFLGRITVTGEPDAPRALALGKTFALERRPDGSFGVQYRLLGLIPIPLSLLSEISMRPASIAGESFVVARYKDHVLRFAQKIPRAPLPPAWQKRLGVWEAVERDALLDLIELERIELRYDDGVLYFYYALPGWLGLEVLVPVKPVSDTELVLHGTGWLMGETVRVVRRGGEEQLRYSGYELRRPKPR